jgi:hypothetical protein
VVEVHAVLTIVAPETTTFNLATWFFKSAHKLDAYKSPCSGHKFCPLKTRHFNRPRGIIVLTSKRIVVLFNGSNFMPACISCGFHLYIATMALGHVKKGPKSIKCKTVEARGNTVVKGAGTY